MIVRFHPSNKGKKLVFLALAHEYYPTYRYSNPKPERLAALADMTVKQVKRNLRELANENGIKTLNAYGRPNDRGQRNSGGRWQQNSFLINIRRLCATDLNENPKRKRKV